MVGFLSGFREEIFQSRHETKINIFTTSNKPIYSFSDRLNCIVYDEKQTNISELFQ